MPAFRTAFLSSLLSLLSLPAVAQWAEIQRLPYQSQDSDNGGSPLYSGGGDVVVAPNGDVLVFYTQNGAFTNGVDGTAATIQMMRSTDFGATWGEPDTLFIEQNSEVQGFGPALAAVNPTSGRITLSFFNLSGSAPDFETGEDVWNSDDSGETWTKAGVIPPADLLGPSLEYASDGRLIYSFVRSRITGDELVFIRSLDDGASWSNPSTIYAAPPNDFLCEHGLSALSETEWLAHQSNCFFGGGGTTTLTEVRTTDAGETWSDPITSLERGSGFLTSTELILDSGGTLWEAYTDGPDQFYRTSSDNGATWDEPTQFTGGMNDGNIECTDAEGGPICVFLATQRAEDPNLPEIFAGQLGVSSDPLIVVSNEDPGDIPGSFSLAQNYPNPFNPATTISFELGTVQHVRVTLHDALGREIAELTSGTRSAGRHDLTVNASRLPSGVYMYRLQSEDGLATRTMTVLK